MSDYRSLSTLAELDRQFGRPKGHAFRCFKALSGQWQEGRDYTLLTRPADAAAIAQLKAEGRAYQSSVSVLLLSESASEKLRRMMEAGGPA